MKKIISIVLFFAASANISNAQEKFNINDLKTKETQEKIKPIRNSARIEWIIKHCDHNFGKSKIENAIFILNNSDPEWVAEFRKIFSVADRLHPDIKRVCGVMIGDVD